MSISRILEKKDEEKLVQLVKRVYFLKLTNLRKNLKSVFRMTPRGYNNAKINFFNLSRFVRETPYLEEG